MKTTIEELKNAIMTMYESAQRPLGDSIYRGHIRTMSFDVENALAVFLSKLLPTHSIFVDSSINVDGKMHRPDILIVDDNGKVEAMVEIKSNMGYCRNASGIINSMLRTDKLFANAKNLLCKFISKGDLKKEKTFSITYNSNVNLFLVSLVTGNVSKENRQKNKKYANDNKVLFYELFYSGYGYSNLKDKDISIFANAILECTNKS